MTWTLTLEGRLPMRMNERERASFWQRKKELDEITHELRDLALEQRIPAATTRRFVLVTIHKGARSRKRDDPGNLHARAKSILDALVRIGVLVDDDERWLDWGGVVEGDKLETKRTVIEVRNAPLETKEAA